MAMQPASMPPTLRLQSLDTVRGVAVLGILLLNIVAFGMPEAAYFNPRAYGGWHGADLVTWLVNFILFDGKMRGLFSFLFGASLLLVIERAEANGQSAATVHFSRMAWLLVFGLAHLFLVWDGDILAHYALVGMIAYLCRNMPVPRLLALGLTLLLAELVIFGSLPLSLSQALAAPPGSTDAAETIADFQRHFGTPSPAIVAHELALYRGGYPGILADRVHDQAAAPIQLLVAFGPETLAYMLFGMAALRSGLLRGEWRRADYRRWALVGLGIGIPAYTGLALYMLSQQFSLFAVMLAALPLAVIVRPLMILGWACLILLLMRPGGALTTRLAAAGRMAFTNYLLTSLICTSFFYGYGLGWFGHLSRAQLYLVVAAMWALMLLWSKPWLTHFRYGPLEWLWRSLARRRPQTMRIIANAPQ
jgi:uncharacterized protein